MELTKDKSSSTTTHKEPKEPVRLWEKETEKEK